jgi:hypothetical protein
VADATLFSLVSGAVQGGVCGFPRTDIDGPGRPLEGGSRDRVLRASRAPSYLSVVRYWGLGPGKVVTTSEKMPS